MAYEGYFKRAKEESDRFEKEPEIFPDGRINWEKFRRPVPNMSEQASLDIPRLYVTIHKDDSDEKLKKALSYIWRVESLRLIKSTQVAAQVIATAEFLSM